LEEFGDEEEERGCWVRIGDGAGSKDGEGHGRGDELHM
jgi:hypothetical protein